MKKIKLASKLILKCRTLLTLVSQSTELKKLGWSNRSLDKRWSLIKNLTVSNGENIALNHTFNKVER